MVSAFNMRILRKQSFAESGLTRNKLFRMIVVRINRDCVWFIDCALVYPEVVLREDVYMGVCVLEYVCGSCVEEQIAKCSHKTRFKDSSAFTFRRPGVTLAFQSAFKDCFAQYSFFISLHFKGLFAYGGL